LRFKPVKVPGAVCACVRAIPAPELFGPGISGAGKVGCNAEGLTDINYRIIQDHNTNPGNTNNKCKGPPDDIGAPDDEFCVAQTTLPGGTVSKACKEQEHEDCMPANIHPHKGVCNSPRMLTLSGGPAGEGSAFILNNTAIGQLADGGACDTSGTRCDVEDYGPDCLPCTDDDLEMGIPNNLPTTTGVAEAAVYDANNNLGLPTNAPCAVIDKDRHCPNRPCITMAEGAPLDCQALIDDPTGGLSGGSLAVAFPAIDAPLIGDNVVTTVFFNK
jgi:hypothetical protein